MPTPSEPALDPTPVQPGQLIHVAEGDYVVGSGLLRLWVAAVGPPYIWHNRDWWQHVQGREYTIDGRRLGGRAAQVRLRRVVVVRLGLVADAE